MFSLGIVSDGFATISVFELNRTEAGCISLAMLIDLGLNKMD